MNRTELEKHKAILEAKRVELSVGLRNRADIAIEKTPDALDEVQLAGERELAIRNLDRGSNLLRSVRGALARIADGSYGICLHCEEEIKPKRLDAVPWTKYCIRCQEAAATNSRPSRPKRWTSSSPTPPDLPDHPRARERSRALRVSGVFVRQALPPNATYFSRSRHSAFVVGRAILPAAAFQAAFSRGARVFGAAVAG